MTVHYKLKSVMLYSEKGSTLSFLNGIFATLWFYLEYSVQLWMPHLLKMGTKERVCRTVNRWGDLQIVIHKEN